MNGFERDLDAFEKEISVLKLEKQDLDARKQEILDKIWEHKLSQKNTIVCVEDEAKKKTILKKLLTRKQKLRSRKTLGKLVFILVETLLILAFLLGGGLQLTVLSSIINLLLSLIYNKHVDMLIDKINNQIESLDINKINIRIKELSRIVLKDNLFSETLKFDLDRIENELNSINEKISELERQYNIVLGYYSEVKDELTDDLSCEQKQGTINNIRKTLLPTMASKIFCKK